MSKRKADDDSVHNEKQEAKSSSSPSKPHEVFVVLYKFDPQSSGGDARCDVKGVFSNIAEANKEAIAAGKQEHEFWSQAEEDGFFRDRSDPKKAKWSQDALASCTRGEMPDEYGIEMWLTKTGERMIEMGAGNGDGSHSVSVEKHLVKEKSEPTSAVQTQSLGGSGGMSRDSFFQATVFHHRMTYEATEDRVDPITAISIVLRTPTSGKVKYGQDTHQTVDQRSLFMLFQM